MVENPQVRDHAGLPVDGLPEIAGPLIARGSDRTELKSLAPSHRRLYHEIILASRLLDNLTQVPLSGFGTVGRLDEGQPGFSGRSVEE